MLLSVCTEREPKLTQAFFNSLSFLKLTPHLGLENLWIRENLQIKFPAQSGETAEGKDLSTTLAQDADTLKVKKDYLK